MLNNINELEICAQRDLPNTIDKLRSLELITKSDSEYQKLRAAVYTSKEWEKGRNISIYFMKDPPSNIEVKRYTLDWNKKVIWDPLQIEIINNYNNFRISDIIPMIKRVIIERIQPIVNLKFNFVDNPFADIRISFDIHRGSWSYLGKDALSIPYNEATMNFGWFNIATVLHEFGHMLGMIHEHQSPFGEPIPWNISEVYKWAADTQKWSREDTNEQILNKYNSTLLNGTVFDKNSIMLYFYPKELTTNNTGTSMNVRLSPYDVFYINSRYSGSTQTPIEFYKNVYGEDISNIQLELPTTLQPVITKVVINNFTNKINKDIQTKNGGLLTTINFEGRIKFLNISITSNSLIYILDKNNNIVFNSSINIGENILSINLYVFDGYKITLQMIDNTEININKLSFDVENFSEKKYITPYIIYLFVGVIILIIVIKILQRFFKYFSK